MALTTAGTDATTSLDAIAFTKAMAAADVATLQQAIKDDLNVAHPTWPGAFPLQGLLYVPNRGILKVLDGDLIAFDDQGWPILISANSIANGTDWTVA